MRLAAALADRYRIERELGQGGMATVYLAQDVKHDRKVALKVLKPELAAVLGAERFVVEIKTTAALQNPHILPLFDSGTADGFLFYVMPFIEGETLRAKLDRETQLSVDDAIRIAREVADALEYAHQHGIVHRDIKPENILLHGGHAMVADFGIALAVSAAAGGRMTETGTPHYMSPEQATAEKVITARSDVYSLGSVLYEMLAGQPPYLGGSAQQIIMKIIAEPVPLVTTLRQLVPPNVAAAVATALEKLPADRFASAAQFAAALGNPSFGADAFPGGGFATSGQGHRGLNVRGVALVAAAALLLGSLGTKLLWRGTAEPPRTSRLMLEFPANQQVVYSSGSNFRSNFPVMTQSPDGSGLVYWGRGTSTKAQLMLRSWNQLSATRLPHTVEEVCCVVLSPRGDSLAYLAGPHALRVAPVGGGIPLTVADSGLTSVTDYGGGVDWAEDGWLYASALDGLIRVSPRGGPAQAIAAIDRQRGDLRYLWPSVLPGARAALVTIIPAKDALNPALAEIGVADFASGKVDILLQGLRAFYVPTGHLVVAKANGTLWAIPFDLASRHVAGRERELPDTVATVGGAVDLSLSRSGTLAYTRRVVQSFEALWVDRTGDARPVAADLKAAAVRDPALSPNGDRLAITLTDADGKANIWVKPLDGGPKSRLTFEGAGKTRPAWRPGTGAISFNSDRKAAAGAFLFERNADGSGSARELDVHERRSIGGGTWSSDGKWLVMRTDNQVAGNADIVAIRLGVDTVPKTLVATDAEEMGPAVSPDGRWLAYSSNESGRREVYVQPFPEAGGARYLVSNAGGITPVWSRNGRELFYADAASNMVAVPVVPGPTFQTREPQVLFSAAGYELHPYFRQFDVTADGSHFVMIRGESDTSVHVVVVFNFLDELKRLMATP